MNDYFWGDEGKEIFDEEKRERLMDFKITFWSLYFSN